jgi:recombinational DNA repair protein (RecF pathway)
MYAFSSSRKTAAQTRPCANCGAPIALVAGSAREADVLCANCARPIRLGAARAPVSPAARQTVSIK